MAYKNKGVHFRLSFLLEILALKEMLSTYYSLKEDIIVPLSLNSPRLLKKRLFDEKLHVLEGMILMEENRFQCACSILQKDGIERLKRRTHPHLSAENEKKKLLQTRPWK